MRKFIKKRHLDSSEEQESKNPAESRGISRRGFIKGAAAGAAFAGSAGLVGNIPSVRAAAKSTEREDVPEGAKPIPPIAPPAKWDKEADVVVIGTGGGGLAGCVKAAENGNRVIAIEKMQSPGGSTKEAGLFFTFGGTRYQNAIKFALPKFPYDPDALVEMVTPMYQHTANKRLIRALAVKGPECVDWMGDHGVEWELDVANDSIFGAGGHIWKGSCQDGQYTRAMKKVTDHMYEVAKQKGAEFLFRTAVVRLVAHNGRIVGVKAKNLKGESFFIHAKKAVLLAAGGFGVNRDMMQQYTPFANRTCAASFAGASDTGEIIRMGIGAGADMAGFNSTGVFDGGVDWVYDGSGTFHQYLYNGSSQLARQPWLSIDITGERYQYLDSSPVTNLYSMPGVQMARPGGRGYVIFDRDYEKHLPKFKQTFCRRPLENHMANMDRIPEWLIPGKEWRKGVQIAINAGAIKKASTIEELGKKLGFDPGVLTESVNQWNSVCKSGKDDPLYGYKPEWLIPIQNPPYYGIRIGGFLFATECGLRVTPQMNVVDRKGRAIRGLYAAFHTAGGAVGENSVSGCSVLADAGLSFASGYIAAETIVKENA